MTCEMNTHHVINRGMFHYYIQGECELSAATKLGTCGRGLIFLLLFLLFLCNNWKTAFLPILEYVPGFDMLGHRFTMIAGNGMNVPETVIRWQSYSMHCCWILYITTNPCCGKQGNMEHVARFVDLIRERDRTDMAFVAASFC